MTVELSLEEIKKLQMLVSIARIHYYRCISTSRQNEEQVDTQNARRIVNEASYQKSPDVLAGLELLERKLSYHQK